MSELETDDVDAIHEFLMDADVVDGPEELYDLVSALWPELLHKVIPPRRLMH